MSAACCGPRRCASAFRDHAAGSIDDDALPRGPGRGDPRRGRAAGGAGFRAVTDGEFRRASYWAHFVEAVDGLGVGRRGSPSATITATRRPSPRPTRRGEGPGWTAGLGRRVRFPERRSRKRRRRSRCPPRRRCISGRRPTARDLRRYTDDDAFFADLRRRLPGRRSPTSPRAAAAMSSSTRCRWLMLCDPAVRARTCGQAGSDPDRLVGLYIALSTGARRPARGHDRRPAHLPRQFPGPVSVRGRLRSGRRAAVRGVAVDALPARIRHAARGRLRAARHRARRTKGVVLGLVSTKTPAARSRSKRSRRRIDEAARYRHRSTGSPSARNAASPAPFPATRSPSTTSAQSLALDRAGGAELLGAEARR